LNPPDQSQMLYKYGTFTKRYSSNISYKSMKAFLIPAHTIWNLTVQATSFWILIVDIVQDICSTSYSCWDILYVS